MPLCEEKTITEARTMDKSELIEKLKKMRLPVIAEQYELQSANPEYSQLSFDERFSELIDMEYDSRVNHTIERFIKNAHFYDSTASMESINYNPDRKLDRSQMEGLSTNNYIKNGLNVIFVGASGCGKTYVIRQVAELLGIELVENGKIVKGKYKGKIEKQNRHNAHSNSINKP